MIRAQSVEVRTQSEHEHERRSERHDSRQQCASDASRGVADDGNGLDDRAGSHLPQGHGIQKLRSGHPVIGDHGTVLHQRNDDEAPAVGQGTDLEGNPDERPEAPDAYEAGLGGHDGGRTPGPFGRSGSSGDDLQCATECNHHDQVRADEGSGCRSEGDIGEPPEPRCASSSGPPPATGDQSHGRCECHRRYCGARTGCSPQHHSRWMAGEEHGGEGDDDRQAGTDEGEPTEQRSRDAGDPPGAEDRQLRGRGAGQQIGCRDAVLEVVSGQPPLLFDAEPTKHGDVRRGTAETQYADPAPLLEDGARSDGRTCGGAHGSRTSSASSRSAAVQDSSVRLPWGVMR